MAARPVLLDANLAVVLAIGLVDPDRIALHKRTRQYDRADYDELTSLIAASAGLLFCPNVATETSNLLDRGNDPLQKRVVDVLAALFERTEERVVPTATAVNRREYARLGVTDSVLLCLAESGAVLVTSDAILHDAALRAGYQSINFFHLKAHRMGI